MSVRASVLLCSLALATTTVAHAQIPFSETFDTFTAAGFAPDPGPGQLDSDLWEATGFSAADDLTRGPSTGGVSSGGVYAFEVGSGNHTLGVQPTTSDFTPGSFRLTLQNDTGAPLTQIQIAYVVWVLNNGDRANNWELGIDENADGTLDTRIDAASLTSPETAEAGAAWAANPRMATHTFTTPVLAGGSFTIAWVSDDVSGGGSRDEFGLDRVSVTQGIVVMPCGNAVVDAGEDCDDGLGRNGTDASCCESDCSFKPADTMCTGATVDGDCDVADSCDGAGVCVDRVASGTECRASAGDCDLAEMCDGVSKECPADELAMGTVCRDAAGDCDIAEMCSGTDVDCPADAVEAADVECRAAAGVCDVAEVCNGIDGACPADSVRADGTDCDTDGACNGLSMCAAGACVDGTAVDCDDDDECTADMCTDPAGTCSNVEIPGCRDADAGPGDEDAGPGDTDAGPGDEDAGPGDTDAGPGDEDAGPGDVDAGGMGTDAGGMGTDAGGMGTDAGGTDEDAGEDVDAGMGGVGGGGGCNCRTSGDGSGAPALLFALGLFVTLRRRR